MARYTTHFNWVTSLTLALLVFQFSVEYEAEQFYFKAIFQLKFTVCWQSIEKIFMDLPLVV